MLKYVPTEDSAELVYRKYILILLNWMHLHLFSQITTSLLNKRQTEAKAPWLVTFLFFSGMPSKEECLFICLRLIYVCIYIYTYWAGSKWEMLFKHLFGWFSLHCLRRWHPWWDSLSNTHKIQCKARALTDQVKTEWAAFRFRTFITHIFSKGENSWWH